MVESLCCFINTNVVHTCWPDTAVSVTWQITLDIHRPRCVWPFLKELIQYQWAFFGWFNQNKNILKYIIF